MVERLYCPVCGSEEIKSIWTNAAAVRLGAPLPKRCEKCGHRGMWFPQVEEADGEKEGSLWDLLLPIIIIVLVFLALYFVNT